MSIITISLTHWRHPHPQYELSGHASCQNVAHTTSSSACDVTAASLCTQFFQQPDSPLAACFPFIQPQQFLVSAVLYWHIGFCTDLYVYNYRSVFFFLQICEWWLHGLFVQFSQLNRSGLPSVGREGSECSRFPIHVYT